MTHSVNRRLTKRDLKIPGLVVEYHLLTTLQIKRLLYFPSLQKTQARLLTLFKAGLVKRFRYPLLLSDGGSGEFIYYYRKRKRISLSGVFHTLQLNEIRISFTEACDNSRGIDMTAFIPEYKGFVSGDGSPERFIEDTVGGGEEGKEARKIIPDAVICLENSDKDKKALFFLELDLGTERIASDNDMNYSLLSKLKRYEDYFRTRGFERYNSWFGKKFRGFRALLVMDSQRRIQRLRAELKKRGIVGFIWFAEKSSLNGNTVFQNIWYKDNIEDENRYSLLDG